MTKRNNSFIAKRCDICDGADCGGAALSSLRLICGYGADHDMEHVDLTICGACADSIYNKIRKVVRSYKHNTSN